MAKYYYINLLATSPSSGLTLRDTFIAFESLLRSLKVIFGCEFN